MKNCLAMVAALIFSPLAFAGSPVPLKADGGQWTCSSQSHPTQIEAKVYVQKDKYFIQLEQAIYTDQLDEDDEEGPSYEVDRMADDLIEAKLVSNDRKGLKFRQVNNSKDAKTFAINFKPTFLTQDAEVMIRSEKDAQGHFRASVSFAKGPLGEKAKDDGLTCW